MFFFDPLFFLIPFFGFIVVARLVSTLLRGGMRRPASPPVTLEPGVPSPQAGRLEGRVFALAYRLGGTLSVSDVVIETGLGTREVETLLDRMADEVHVRVVVSDEGRIRYEFPEIQDRLQRERGGPQSGAQS